MDPSVAGAVLIALIAALAVVVLLRSAFRTTTVFEHQRALRFVRGRYAGDRGPGRYRHLRSTQYWLVDTRATLLTVAGQEAPSADGVAVRASLLAVYRVADARVAMLSSSNYAASLHAYLQLALRTVVASHPVEELMAGRGPLDAELLVASRDPARLVGVELESVAIRDLSLSSELKSAFANVVKARQEGLAALERARGETAALRNLANAAQSLERNPALLQLRVLHALGQQPGARLVLNFPGVPSTEPGAPGS